MLFSWLDFQVDSSAACPLSHMLGGPSFGFVNSKVLWNSKVLEPHPFNPFCELLCRLAPQDSDCTEASGMIHYCQHTLTSTYLTLFALCSRCAWGWLLLGNCRLFTLNPMTVNLDSFIELRCLDTRAGWCLRRLLSRIARRADIVLCCRHHIGSCLNFIQHPA